MVTNASHSFYFIFYYKRRTDAARLFSSAGAVRVWESADGVCFSRFTEEENVKIYAYSKFVNRMAQTLTGVRLDFYTDARAISFMLAKGNVVDVWLNGVFRQTVHCETLRDKGESAARIPLVDPLGAPYEKTRDVRRRRVLALSRRRIFLRGRRGASERSRLQRVFARPDPAVKKDPALVKRRYLHRVKKRKTAPPAIEGDQIDK